MIPTVVSSITHRHCGLDPQSHYNDGYHAIADRRFALSAMTIRHLSVDTTLRVISYWKCCEDTVDFSLPNK